MARALRQKGTGKLFAFTDRLAVRDDMEEIDLTPGAQSASQAAAQERANQEARDRAAAQLAADEEQRLKAAAQAAQTAQQNLDHTSGLSPEQYVNNPHPQQAAAPAAPVTPPMPSDPPIPALGAAGQPPLSPADTSLDLLLGQVGAPEAPSTQ